MESSISIPRFIQEQFLFKSMVTHVEESYPSGGCAVGAGGSGRGLLGEEEAVGGACTQRTRHQSQIRNSFYSETWLHQKDLKWGKKETKQKEIHDTVQLIYFLKHTHTHTTQIS